MNTLFGSWLASVSAPSVTDVAAGNAVSYWPAPAGGYSSYYPGTASAAYPWSSTIARVVVRYRVPAGTLPQVVLNKVADATSVLDAMLPAWAAFVIAPSPADGSTGFTLGSGILGTTTLLEA